MAKCARCGTETGDAKFCTECGLKIDKPNTCPTCGADTNGANFCPACGTPQSTGQEHDSKKVTTPPPPTTNPVFIGFDEPTQYRHENKKEKRDGLLGFRRGHAWAMILAILYLVITAMALIGNFLPDPEIDLATTDALVRRLYSVNTALIMLGPFVAFSNFGFYKKIPLLRKDTAGARMAVLAIWVAVLIVAGAGINALHTPEYWEAYNAREARVEQENAEIAAEREAQKEIEREEKAAQKAAEEERKRIEEEEAKEQREREQQEKEAEEKRQEEEAEIERQAKEAEKAKAEEEAEKAKAAEAAEKEKAEEEANKEALLEQVKALGYTQDEAQAITEVLRNVGIEKADDVWTIVDNPPLKANALKFDGAIDPSTGSYRQVNFTTEDGKLFFVQITGWAQDHLDYGWYTSLMGKLKYGIHSDTDKLAFDLYATDIEDGGYLMYYDASDDSVHAWGE